MTYTQKFTVEFDTEDVSFPKMHGEDFHYTVLEHLAHALEETGFDSARLTVHRARNSGGNLRYTVDAKGGILEGHQT